MTDQEWAIKSWKALARAYEGSRLDGASRKVRERWLRRFGGGDTVQRRRRTRLRKNGGKHTAQDIVQILDQQGGLCLCCRIDVSRGFHVDHVVPIALGGSDNAENLQILCGTCNKIKGSTIISIIELRKNVTVVTGGIDA